MKQNKIGINDRKGNPIKEGDTIKIIVKDENNFILKHKIEWIKELCCYSITPYLISNHMYDGMDNGDKYKVEFEIINKE